MLKRGQVTIFIILAVLIVGIGAGIYAFRQDLGIGNKNSDETNSVKEIVNSCLDKTTEEGINYIALHGGYYTIPNELKFSYFTDEYAYYYINSQKHIPSQETINNELQKYVLFYLKDCINFSAIEKQGNEITQGELKVSSEIDEDVFVEINYPLTIKKEDNSFRLTEFDTKVEEKVLNLYLASMEITEGYSLNKGLICLNCLDEISDKYNVDAKATSLEDKNAIAFSVADLDNDELNWKFILNND